MIMKFVSVNCCRLILICQFVLLKLSGISGIFHACDESAVPRLVRIALIVSLKHRVHIDLKLTNPILANEHLPVWIMEGKVDGQCEEDNGGPELKLDDTVMQQLGKFSFYQDSRTSSAAVYFHKRHQFDGMIDSRYLIQGLPIDKLRRNAKSLIKLGESGIILRPQSLEHPSPIPDQSPDIQTEDVQETITTYENHLYDAYPEILVVVSHELVENFLRDTEETNGYVSIVSHILELFNGVDMLYSKLKMTNIKLNIAGVIIASECESVTLIKNCYEQLSINSETPSDFLCTDPIPQQFIKYFEGQNEAIPTDSYDAVVYLTKRRMFHMVNERRELIHGIASMVPVYKARQLNIMPLLIATVRNDESLENHGNTAHELAHLMNVLHDEGPFSEEGECCGHIMKTEGTYWCSRCLTWSDKSEEEFKRFYSSANCCGFINFPQSLFTRGRREKVTDEEQCRCYGFKSSIPSGEFRENYCSSKLKCLDDVGTEHETVFPMDGTKCGIGKVCWNRKCRSITDTQY